VCPLEVNRGRRDSLLRVKGRKSRRRPDLNQMCSVPIRVAERIARSK